MLTVQMMLLREPAHRFCERCGNMQQIRSGPLMITDRDCMGKPTWGRIKVLICENCRLAARPISVEESLEN